MADSNIATNTYNKDLDIISIAPEDVRTSLLTLLENGCGEPLYPGDERRIFGEALTAVLVSLYFAVNDAVRQCLLAFAHGQALDAIGERVKCARLQPVAASTKLRFSLAETRSVNTYIPKWTKVSGNGDYYFATDEDTVIPAGAYNVDVTATALNTGADYNGILAGSITTMVDQIAYVTGVVNLTETAGGEDGEPYTEAGDNAFRERIKLAPEAFSVAGPKGAYEYWAKTADAGVQDCLALTPTVEFEQTLIVSENTAFLYIEGLHVANTNVYAHGEETPAVYGDDYTMISTDEKSTITLTEGGALDGAELIDIKGERDLAGHVIIYALMEGSTLPSDAQCEMILKVVDNESVRPMCDYVDVRAPERVFYDIDITYYCSNANASAVLSTVEGAGGALERYRQWQGEKIGRTINPDELRKMLLKPDWSDTAVGVTHATITAPTYLPLKENQVAVCRSVNALRVIE